MFTSVLTDTSTRNSRQKSLKLVTDKISLMREINSYRVAVIVYRIFCLIINLSLLPVESLHIGFIELSDSTVVVVFFHEISAQQWKL